MSNPWSGQCTICGKDCKHVNNHVRQSKDGGHGEYGKYPDNWDKVTRSIRQPHPKPQEREKPQEPQEPTPPTSHDETPGVTVESHSEPAADFESQSATHLELSDSPADSRSYQCSCGQSVEYLADCEGCNETLQWSGVAA